MKFANQFAALAALSLASAQQNVTLTVDSAENSTLNGYGLSPIHFGAGTNGVMLSQSVSSFNYDPDTKRVSQVLQLDIGPTNFNFTESYNVLNAGVFGAPFALVEDGYLTVNGSNSVFYACSQLAWDPYHYASPSNLGVGVYASDAPNVCSPIKIKAVIYSATPSGGANVTKSGTSTSSASFLPVQNASTTVQTKWTTIPCPTPTTLTYNSKTYTVTEATTLTVEDCSCTDSPKTTVVETKWTTIPCPTPTTLTYNSKTYTVTEATTLTVEDCSCTDTPKTTLQPVPTASSSSSQISPVNGASKNSIYSAALIAIACYVL